MRISTKYVNNERWSVQGTLKLRENLDTMNYGIGCYRKKRNNTFTVNESKNFRLKSQQISCKKEIL